jgi:Na+-translocating ferredoxin:NAD+ oxidoreductase RnfG subunit
MLHETKAKARKPAVKQQVKPSKSSKDVKKAATKSKLSQTGSRVVPVTPEQRQAMIREAAYYLAEREGFAGCSPLENWLMAEAEIDRQLMQQVSK